VSEGSAEISTCVISWRYRVWTRFLWLKFEPNSGFTCSF